MSALSPHAQASLHTVQVLGGGSAGTGAHVRSLAEGLVARGVRVTVCAPRGAELSYGFTSAGAHFAPTSARTEPEAVSMLRAVCADADLVHAHGLRAGLLAALALGGRRRRIPLVVTWHTRAHTEGFRAQVMRLLERRVAKAAKVVLGASSDLVERARRRGARDARLAPVAIPAPRSAQDDGAAPGSPPPYGDDDRLHAKVRAELGAVERPLVFTIGRLEPHQGHDSLLTAARAWRHLGPPPLLAIAGEGTRRAEMQHRIDTEALPVRLLGRRDDALRLLAAADVAVLPGSWEARSLFAQEALYAGVPLVATEVGGVPELVGDAAVLVPYGDADALAAAVAGLLADPARRVGLAAAGRAQAAAWPTEDTTVAQVLSVYDELAHSGR
ncbi:glycosyltransferase family 4 protein [Streptomyces gobiensis]|uniref:glycosyltransferase family 4 protein n=1 Tax=Streptomyces gobiensis TaxID=2875706 RepID=UPI001E5B12E3|nr:glycosyltransferase family 4 protein [Streptomyces gobiensis]UGY94971.1 glycosyltransferase family 4 protein [Streptomyces gobiensis]